MRRDFRDLGKPAAGESSAGRAVVARTAAFACRQTAIVPFLLALHHRWKPGEEQWQARSGRMRQAWAALVIRGVRFRVYR